MQGYTLPKWLKEACLSLGMKYCHRCDTLKSTVAYANDCNTSDGFKSVCRQCASEIHAAWRVKNLKKVRANDRVNSLVKNHKGRLTKEQAKQHTENRFGVCACCGSLKMLVLDHDHVTNLNRDRICGSCNSMLGYARDNPAILMLGAEYLKFHGKGE